MIFIYLALIIFIHMCLVWCLYRYLDNPAIVDVGWTSGLTLSGLFYLYSFPITLRTMMLSFLLIVWGARLGIYLWYTRIRLGKVDKRYLALSDHWKIAKPLGFFLNFQLQGVLIFIISLPWFFSAATPAEHLSILDYAAVIMTLVGLLGETLADYQLQVYKKNPNTPVCQQGLWNYSRHPNYFFECLIWLAFACFGFSHPYGEVGFISPILLYLMMVKITGPLTEEGSIKSRGQAYLDYQKSTSMIIPGSNKVKSLFRS